MMNAAHGIVHPTSMYQSATSHLAAVIAMSWCPLEEAGVVHYCQSEQSGSYMHLQVAAYQL